MRKSSNPWLYPHNLNFEFSENYFENWTPQDDVEVGLPYPIHHPFKECEKDMIKEFENKSTLYAKTMLPAKNRYEHFKKKLEGQDYASSKYITIYKELLTLHDLFDWESPYKCDYHPYYRGSLDSFTLDGSNFLIRPNVDNELCVTDTSQPEKTMKLNLKEPFRSSIYSVESLKYNSEILLNVCQLNNVNILSVENVEEEISIKWKKKFKKPILDSKLNQKNLGLISKSLDFVVYDINEDKVIFETADTKINEIIKMDWINEHFLGLMSQKNLKLLDSRCLKHATFEPKGLYKCDTFCNFKINGNTIYGIMRDSLIRSDLRMMDTVEFCSHLSRTEPCYFDFIEYNHKEFLCLSEQNTFDDKLLFCCNNKISGLPLKVPSLYNTLKLCKLKGDCLLIDHLNERLNYSTIGIKLLIENNTDIVLYSANFIGELFKQTFNKYNDNWATEKLNQWIGKLPKQKTILNLNSVCNLNKIREILHDINYNDKTNDEDQRAAESDDEIGGEAPKFFQKFFAKYRTDNLGEMGGGFASIWDDQVDEDEDDDRDDLASEINPSEKVNDWIKSLECPNFIDDINENLS